MTGAEIARRVFCELGTKRVPAMRCWERAYLDLRAGRSPRATSAVQRTYRWEDWSNQKLGMRVGILLKGLELVREDEVGGNGSSS